MQMIFSTNWAAEGKKKSADSTDCTTMHDKAGRTHTAHHPGVSSLGVSGVSWHPQILADQLTLSQSGGSRLCPPNNTGTLGFSDFPTALPPHTLLHSIPEIMPTTSFSHFSYFTWCIVFVAALCCHHPFARALGLEFRPGGTVLKFVWNKYWICPEIVFT